MESTGRCGAVAARASGDLLLGIVAQRLIPRAEGSGRLPVFEIVKSNGRTRECVEKGEHEGKTLVLHPVDPLKNARRKRPPRGGAHAVPPEKPVSFDPPKHTAHRALLNGLFTPKRLKENEEFMWHLADRLIDEFIADGRCEFASAYGQPFPLLVIADLLGVPEEHHAMFRKLLAGNRPAVDPEWAQHDADGTVNMNPLSYLDKWFTAYITDRRASPKEDILTEMATQSFPDGSRPEVVDLVRIATFLFIAGHETTARLLSSSLCVLAEDPDLQDTLRRNRERIPNFVEEMLRLESPIKSDFRLTRVATTLGGVDLPAGTTMMLLPGAANRDPAHFDCPAELRVGRSNARQNVAFARGVHSCPGGPLARIEGRVTIGRILDRMSHVQISEAHHGPAGARRFDHVPLYILRGLDALHLEFTAA